MPLSMMWVARCDSHACPSMMLVGGDADAGADAGAARALFNGWGRIGELWLCSCCLARRSPRRPVRRLTRRQTEVLRLLARGLSSKQIAAELDVDVKTVESHRHGLMDRLGVRGVANLVRYAFETGIIGTRH